MILEEKKGYSRTAIFIKREIVNVRYGLVLENSIEDAIIHSDIMGSDHCPVELLLEEK